MAKAKLDLFDQLPDLTALELPPAAARTLYAGVGATDLAVERVRDAIASVHRRLTEAQKDVQTRVADVQESVKGLELEPRALGVQAVTVANARVEALTEEAKARRAAVEARVAELQEALTDNVATVTGTYVDLAQRGEGLVARIRNQESTRATAASARTTTAKARSTRTQAGSTAKKSARSATAGASKAATTAKKSSARSSAKATGTAARKTGANAAKAAADAAGKVGD